MPDQIAQEIQKWVPELQLATGKPIAIESQLVKRHPACPARTPDLVMTLIPSS